MALNVVIGLGVLAVAVVAFWSWVAFVRRRANRLQELGRPGPATMELGSEPPAVVNLLIHELEITGDALAATLLDLAARDYLEIFQLSPEHYIVRPTRRSLPLRSFEEQVLATVEQAAARAPDGVVTVEALTSQLGPGTVTTWARFKQLVILDAKGAGLVHEPTTGEMTKPLVILGILMAAGPLIMLPVFWISAPFMFVGTFLVGVIFAVWNRTLQLTTTGLEAGERWLGVRSFLREHGTFDELPAGAVELWDRYLAYAAAFGDSDVAVHGIVSELRTTMSVSDIRTGARFLRVAMRAGRDQKSAKAYSDLLSSTLYGADARPDQPLGPDDGDFYTLLARTAKGLSLLGAIARTESDVARAAVDRRLVALTAAAPAELADDVRRLVPIAEVYVGQMLRPGAGDATARLAELAADPDVAAAANRVLTVVAGHLGVARDYQSVSQALTLR